MPKVAAVIPVLLGSTRIPDKNLILVDGKPLCEYSIEQCIASGAFDAVYLNSADDVFAEIAAERGVLFHKRPESFGGRGCTQSTKSRDCQGQRCVINDHYLYNFMSSIDADYVCQVNATSPLLAANTMRAFVNTLVEGQHDSLFATRPTRAESFIAGKPVTFSRNKKVPSQELVPIDIICWAIAGWKRSSFISCYDRDDATEPGPVFGGELGLFPIHEVEALDIDDWSTLEVVEQLLVAARGGPRQWHYRDGRSINRDGTST